MSGQGQGQGQGRGRARARAQAQKQQQQPPQPHRGPTEPVPSSSSATTSGRALVRSGADTTKEVTKSVQSLSISQGNGSNGGNGNGGNGNNGAPTALGRGTVRSGRRNIFEAIILNTRPETASNKKGTSGTPIKVQSNFFKLITAGRYTIYKHHVDFLPEEHRTFMKKKLMRPHLQKLPFGHLFDGSSIFSHSPICAEEEIKEFFSERESDKEKIRMTVKRSGTCERSDYQYLQIFNILTRTNLSQLGLVEMRRNYFDPQAKVTLNELRLELWPGYVLSIGQYESDILMQAEITYKVIRKDTAYQLFHNLFDRKNRGENIDVKKEFSSAMVGCVVMTSYNDKTYRVDEVDYSVTPRLSFKRKTREGSETNVTLIDYYKSAYNCSVKDVNQPLLVSRSKARDRRAGKDDIIYLVPEFCIMTGITDDMRSNYNTMRALANVTSVAPGGNGGRIDRLRKFNNRLQSNEHVVSQFNRWGMKLSRDLVEFEGRELQLENIVVGDGMKFSAGPDLDWTKSLRSNKMLRSAIMGKWVIIYPSRNDREARMLTELLQKAGHGMKFTIGQPVPCQIQNDNTMAYIQKIEEVVNKENPSIVVCLVPNNRGDRYNAIKKKCVVDKSVPSQVVTTKSVNAKSAMSIATKIAVQINCKIGGAPWSVEIPMKKLMVIGFDVCHDPRSKGKSFGAMVASMDGAQSIYYSTVSHHATGNELSSNFGISVSKCVSQYKHINGGTLPEYIIIFRDGVGDGNIAYVLEQEVKSVEKDLRTIYGKTPRLGFVIVSKRINTRLFVNNNNPRPGTVVDDVITNPFRFDFYLVSQTVKQGTVSPTHYNVIHDTTSLKPDHYQRLTYKLTHMYFNWSGTVRVPAPCQYAHKLAFLTANSIQSCATHLDNLLYYL